MPVGEGEGSGGESQREGEVKRQTPTYQFTDLWLRVTHTPHDGLNDQLLVGDWDGEEGCKGVGVDGVQELVEANAVVGKVAAEGWGAVTVSTLSNSNSSSARVHTCS